MLKLRPVVGAPIALLVGELLLGSAAAPAQEPIRVPGGTKALVRLAGNIDESPHDFLLSLNRVLLVQIRKTQDWKDIEHRVELIDYLSDLEGLTRKFSSTIRIGLDEKQLRKSFQALAGELGYKIRFKGGRFEVLPKEGEGGDRRRRLARALGWDLTAIGESLVGGGETTLEIPVDLVTSPFQLPGEWRMVTGRAKQTTTLEEFIKDQNLGLLLEGRRRLSADSSALMARVGWSWIYERAPPVFFRYARSLRFSDGHLVVPGGVQSAVAWTDILGSSPDEAVPFVRDLLTKKNARGLYLWDSLSWVPDGVAKFYLGTGGASTADERKFARRLYNRLDETSHLDFNWPRGGDLGFGTFVRSVPLLPDHAGLDLPGGPGLWFSALRGSDSPRTPTALARLVRRGLESDLEEGEFLLKVLTEDVKVAGVSQPVLPRLIRAANLFGGRRELLTPGNVVLLARSSDHYPAALSVLEALVLKDPDSIRDYLLAVAHLDALDSSVESELLLENFQGGVEWLRAMAAAGRVPAAVLEAAFRSWARLHLGVTDPFVAGPRELAWTVDLLHQLPPELDQAVGRGPLERAMIAAMIGPRDPQRFEWAGLEYEGRRGEELASAMARNLVTQGIPSADQLEALKSGFDALAPACAAGDVDNAHRHASALLAVLDSFDSGLEPSKSDKELWSRIFAVDRHRVRTILQSVLKQGKSKALARKSSDVEDAERLLAREIRPFLLAPVYLLAMGDEDNLLFADPHLIRSHLLRKTVGPDLVTDNPWKSTEVVASEHAELGSYVLGHLGGVSSALAEFSRATAGGSQTASDRVWFGEFRNTRWHLLDRATSRLVHVLTEAGREILAAALEDLTREDGGRYADFVARRVPRARLESQLEHGGARGAVSPSELFELGFGALVGDAFDKQGGLEISPSARARFDEAVAESGDDWRAKLDRVGAATPNLNGRSSPSVGDWPPYEAVEHETKLAALIERQLLDVKLAVIEYLGRHRLPGVVGADLAVQVLRDATVEMKLETFRDWEGRLLWINGLGEDYFDGKMRACFSSGLYSARGF